MVLKNALKYSALLVGALVLLGVVVSIVAAIVGMVWSIVTAVATLLVVLGLLYGGAKAIVWLRSDGGAVSESPAGSGVAGSDLGVADAGSEGSIDRLRRQYAAGRLSEAELERRLELELDDGGVDEIDRELARERR